MEEYSNRRLCVVGLVCQDRIGQAPEVVDPDRERGQDQNPQKKPLPPASKQG